MILIVKNSSSVIVSLNDLGISIPPYSSKDLSIRSNAEIEASNDLLLFFANSTLVANDGTRDLSATDAIRYVLGQSIEPRDWSGKIFYHPTARPFGTKVHFTGTGDYADIISDIGSGTEIEYHHKIGDPLEYPIYIDLNTIANMTHIQEGYLQWIDAFCDRITVEFVPIVVSVIPGENTPYLFDPTKPILLPSEFVGGNGNVAIVNQSNEVVLPSKSLVQALPNEKGVKPPAFWNADYNSETGLFENITPSLEGIGDYNIFHIEYQLARFANRVGMLGSNVLAFHTDDSDPIPHGSRIKITFETCHEDHEWVALINFKLHREKSC